MDFSKWAFNNRNLIYFFIAVLVVGGAYSCYEMSKLEDPEIKVKLAMVVTTYPGASAHEVELEVTDVIEKEIRTMNHIDNVESYSFNDLSLIQVELTTTTKDEEVEQCWDMLRRKVDNAALPEGASQPIVKDDFGNVFGMFYALTGDGLSERELADYAELIQREVNNIESVDRVDLYGKRPECIYISLLQDRMANLGVKPAEVLTTLNGQNKTTYSGYFDNGEQRIRLHVTDKLKTVDDIGQMLIQGHDDDQLRLSDIAHIEKGYEEPTRNALYRNDQRAIGILVAASGEADIVKVGSEVDRCIEQLKDKRLPAGTQVEKVFFQPQRVGESLGTFVINLIESVAIVVLILMWAMGFKSGMIIGISLVITVLGSFLFLLGAGGTMQRVSLGAFILAMGMLVDNAIVIIDGILVDLKAGKPRMEALTAIGRQTAMPLLGATLIAIIAFLPIFLSPDTAGVYTRDLFIVLAVSLLLSWVLALLHVPLMANRKLHPAPAVAANDGAAPDADDGADPAYQGWAYRMLRQLLGFGLSHRWSMVIAMVGLLLLSLVGFQFMRQGFFPDMVYDQLYMEYKLPEGTNSTQVTKDLQEIECYLRSRSEVKDITMSVGGTPGRYNLVRSVANPSLSYGELIIDFTSPKALVDNMDEIQDYLTSHYPQAYVKLKRYNLMFKKYPIEAQFLGPDPAVLHQLADSARAIMERTPEVCLITTDWEPRVPVLHIEYDQAAARALGLSRSDVSMSLLTIGGGIPIGSFYDGRHKESIYLKCLDEHGRPVEELTNAQVFSTLPSLHGLMTEEMMVKLRSGNISKEEMVESVMGSTPLRQVVKEIRLDWEDPVIPRYNGQRSQRVQCSPAPGIETEKAWQKVSAQLEQMPLPTGYALEWQGEKNASTRSMKYLFKNFPLAIILMIAILIMLFKDYRKPLIIFCCIPLIIVGVVAVMLLTGKTFNFVAIVGTLGLIGMLIKNGIVLMDEITLQLGRGVAPIKALMDSAQSRLRPVMMASLTTILGMIPLLTDAMFGSLAASIMGGLLFASVITLLFIPVLYALFFHIKTKN
ncbi:MAG: efflux RND transporter permease subunit [Bacteroides sp.]